MFKKLLKKLKGEPIETQSPSFQEDAQAEAPTLAETAEEPEKADDLSLSPADSLQRVAQQPQKAETEPQPSEALTSAKGFFAKLKQRLIETEAAPDSTALDEQEEKAEATPLADSLQEGPQQPQKAETEPAIQEETAPAEGFFARLKQKLAKSKEGFVRRMDELLLGKKEISPEILDELEEILVTADVGVKTASEIFEQIRAEVKRKELNDVDALRERIQFKLLELLNVNAPPLTWKGNPCVVLVVGVNGVGKTTTIAKLTYFLQEQGKTCLLAAADTFRAAAIEQLDTWGQRLNTPVIKHKHGADPSAVAFDAIEAGIKRKVDVVIIDTAGRLHTKTNLMEELKKIRRVIAKKIPDAPHETFLVLDATTGQNALSQAKLFREATDLTGIILTKLDGTAKGGIVAAIAHQMRLPIRFIGIGEKMYDLRPFDAKDFVAALFERDTQGS